MSTASLAKRTTVPRSARARARSSASSPSPRCLGVHQGGQAVGVELGRSIFCAASATCRCVTGASVAVVGGYVIFRLGRRLRKVSLGPWPA